MNRKNEMKLITLSLFASVACLNTFAEPLIFTTEKKICPSNTLEACARAMKYADGYICHLMSDRVKGLVSSIDKTSLEELLKEAKKGGKRLFLSYDMREISDLRLREAVEIIGDSGLKKDDVWFRLCGYGNIGAHVSILEGHPVYRHLGTATGQKAVNEVVKLAPTKLAGVITPYFAESYTPEDRAAISGKGFKIIFQSGYNSQATNASALKDNPDAIVTDNAFEFKTKAANWTCEIPESPYMLYVGAGSPSLDMLSTNCAALEAEAPFDGLLFHMGATMVMHTKPVDKAKLAENVEKYKKIPFKKYRRNFLMTMIDQCDPKWFDDAAWEIFTENFRLAAVAARDAGMAGICFDSECYGRGGVRRAWNSSVQAKDGHTTNDCLRIARERGRQIGRAIFDEYPTMHFFGFYLWSFNVDMMGAFCNGMLEVMPISARMIDGNEWNGYVAKGPYTYKWHAWENMRGFGWLDKALQGKQREVGETAPAFYLDAYADPKSGCILREGKPRDKYLARNLLGAKRFSGGNYIWMYGEAGSFWKSTTKPKRKLWEEKIPGVTKVLFGDNQ